MKNLLLFLISVCCLSFTACNSKTIDVTGNTAESANIFVREEEEINKHNKDGYSCYKDGIFGFSVEFPTIWSCESSAYRTSTETENGSPDSDVYIYIDGRKENYIIVYGQHGQINPLKQHKEEFTATNFIGKNGKSATLYLKQTDSQTEGQLFFEDNKHISAYIRMATETFNENNQEIMYVLKSIEYLQK